MRRHEAKLSLIDTFWKVTQRFQIFVLGVGGSKSLIDKAIEILPDASGGKEIKECYTAVEQLQTSPLYAVCPSSAQEPMYVCMYVCKYVNILYKQTYVYRSMCFSLSLYIYMYSIMSDTPL